MTNFTYGMDIGSVNDNVFLTVELAVKGVGFDDADYTELKKAMKVVEDLIIKYKDLEDMRLLNDGK